MMEKLQEDVKTIKIQMVWIQAYLNSELGFKPKPDSPQIEGTVNKNHRELRKEYQDDISGNGKMGIKTKVAIMWYVHSVISALFGAFGMFLLNHFFRN